MDPIAIIERVGFPVFMCLWLMWEVRRHAELLRLICNLLVRIAATLEIANSPEAAELIDSASHPIPQPLPPKESS